MTAPSSAREIRVGQLFVRLADSLVMDFDVVELLDELITSCVDLLEATAAGLMLADQRGQLQVMAASTEQTWLLELFEIQNQQGPCLDCYRGGEPLASVSDDDQANRWPLFAAELRARRFGPVYALPMRLRNSTIGALNLFRLPGESLRSEDLQLGQALADVATIAIMQHRNIRAVEELAVQLQTALNSRIAIEQAKGVIAQFAHVDMDRAFELLRGHARATRVGLSELATAIAAGRLAPDAISLQPPGT
ncbi:MAG: ANTAR domain-containing protein [Jatrophihabitantaceae bacterium]